MDPQSMKAANYIAHDMYIMNIIRELTRLLTRPLVLYIAGMTREQLDDMNRGGGVTRDQDGRLRLAYQTMRFLRDYEGDDTIRAFFIGRNPTLNDETPADAIRADRSSDVLAAATCMVTNGYA